MEIYIIPSPIKTQFELNAKSENIVKIKRNGIDVNEHGRLSSNTLTFIYILMVRLTYLLTDYICVNITRRHLLILILSVTHATQTSNIICYARNTNFNLVSAIISI